MEERWRDMGWRVTARVQPQTNFNIHPSPSLSSISSLIEGGTEGSLIGGKLPRSPWPEAGWGLQCVWVCVSRGGRGRRQHPGRTLGTRFPAALATLLLRLHQSLPAGSMLPSSGGFPLFPKAMPSLLWLSLLAKWPRVRPLASLICPFPGLWYSVHVPRRCLSPSLPSDVQ